MCFSRLAVFNCWCTHTEQIQHSRASAYQNSRLAPEESSALLQQHRPHTSWCHPCLKAKVSRCISMETSHSATWQHKVHGSELTLFLPTREGKGQIRLPRAERVPGIDPPESCRGGVSHASAPSTILLQGPTTDLLPRELQSLHLDPQIHFTSLAML